jgi:hypothetical protein
MVNINSAMKNELTVDRLHYLLNYDGATGEFTWRVKRRGCAQGSRAGCRMKSGYDIIRLDNMLHLAHRLAWLHTTGSWPAHQIDHINGDRADNRISNLREATNIENAHNRRKRRNNKSGYAGVRVESHKWLAEIKVNYKPIRLGLFATPEEASEAYQKARKKYHPFSTHQ